MALTHPHGPRERSDCPQFALTHSSRGLMGRPVNELDAGFFLFLPISYLGNGGEVLIGPL